MEVREGFEELRNGVVLAELGGLGDGPYCAVHGQNAALVMLGTYIVDQSDSVPYDADFVFKPGKENYTAYLQKHIAEARKSGAKVGVSVISVNLSDTVDFLQAAQEAGADYVSLCAHSDMDMFKAEGLGEALCRRENLKLLEKWTSEILHAVRVPFILKAGLGKLEDMSEALKVAKDVGVTMVHINIMNSAPGSEGLQALRALADDDLFLIASGGIRDIEGAKRVLEAGADAVSIGTAATEDPELCGRINKLLKE